MLKVKLINEKTPLKIKMVAKFPSVVLANLQDKEVIPTKETQVVVADKTYDGLSKVTVNPIPDEYIIPSGEIEFTQNGTYDVTDKASAKVNIKEKVLGTKTITSNGTYKATNDNLDGYSEVEVATSGVDINDYFKTKASSIFQIKYYIKKVPSFDLTETITMNNAFNYCNLLQEIPAIDTSQVQNFSDAFSSCSSLVSIPKLNCQEANNIFNMVGYCKSLTTLGGFENLGQNYSTSQSANYSRYKLDLSSSTKLTEQSIINILNNLYDIKTKGVKPQQLILGSGNLAKLSEEEIAIAQNKGWSVS